MKILYFINKLNIPIIITADKRRLFSNRWPDSNKESCCFFCLSWILSAKMHLVLLQNPANYFYWERFFLFHPVKYPKPIKKTQKTLSNFHINCQIYLSRSSLLSTLKVLNYSRLRGIWDQHRETHSVVTTGKH